MIIKKLEIVSSQKTEFIPVSDLINDVLAESGFEEGVVHIFLPHTTAGLLVNDRVEHVNLDLIRSLAEIAPDDWEYRHLAGNSPAHIKSILLGAATTIPFQSGKMLLGEWQQIYFCEFDGPKPKKIILSIQGNAFD